METYSSAFVCLLGIGTVFFGLVCLIMLTKLMSFLGKTDGQAEPAKAVPTTGIKEQIGPEFIAAVSAAIAEDLGTEITGIRILSVKKL